MTAKRKQLYKVVVYPDWCKGCGICAAFCPKKVLCIDHQGKARVDREDECINCGFCELHCPDFAVVVLPRNGLATAESGRAAEPAPEPQAVPAPAAPPASAEPAATPEPKTT